jgi:4'-phosphopantetheinyl transferase
MIAAPAEPRAPAEPPDHRAALCLSTFDFSSAPGPVPELGNEEIHLWHGIPDDDTEKLQRLIDLLSEDERARMARFHFSKDRRDFAFARGKLRTLLGRYLEAAPGELRFSYSEQGKPHLAAPYSKTGLEFNLSHTSGRVLMAVCRRHQVGTDIEKFREDIDVDAVSERFFSAREREAFGKIPGPLRRAAFFHCWTRKEALVKAQGDGLTFPLDLFDVSIDADEHEVELRTRPDPEKARQWCIFRVPVPRGYAAAVAARFLEVSAAGIDEERNEDCRSYCV